MRGNPSTVTEERTTIDLNGTPDDSEDDTVISDELIFGSTGTNDDFCEVAVNALT